LPVVSTANISDDSEIIEKNKIGAIIRTFEKADYQRVVSEIDQLLQENTSKNFEKIRQIAFQYRSFEIAEQIYSQIYG